MGITNSRFYLSQIANSAEQDFSFQPNSCAPSVKLGETNPQQRGVRKNRKRFMKRLFIFIMTSLCFTSIYAQCEKGSLYDNLFFTNGICEKDFIVEFLSFGKNPLINVQNEVKNEFEGKIKRLPNSSVAFLYNGTRYYISVDNKCDLSKISKGDSIRVKIVFFEDIRQPHKYENNFALIKKITLYSSRRYLH